MRLPDRPRTVDLIAAEVSRQTDVPESQTGLRVALGERLWPWVGHPCTPLIGAAVNRGFSAPSA